MDEQRILFTGLAALPIIIPIALAWRAYATAGLTIRLFLFFLVAGLITDLVMWAMLSLHYYDLLVPVFNVYSLLESLMFFWLIQKVTVNKHIRTVARFFLVINIPLWIGSILLYPLVMSGESSRSVPFDTIYEIAVAFLSGFALLTMTETETSTSSPYLWLLLGMFFYCFCTFFLMALLGTELSQKIWFMNNIINNITYILYSIGLYRAGNTELKS